ncbi:unnamed protein product, partial [Meganyctiphanes norvegica]
GREHSVWAVVGERAELPCPSSNNLPADDKPVIVLWYRGTDEAPIYSYDARSSEFTSGEQWSREEVLGNRAYFIPKLDPPKLVLEPVHLSDEGVYHCRVEYPITASTINTVNLTLVVPSPRPSVVWQGTEVESWVGPVNEGSLVDLVCRVRGGRPPPNLTWWQQERRLEGQQEQRTPPHHLPHSGASNGGWLVESRVVLVATRDLYNTPLSCHAHTQVDPPSYLPQLPPSTKTVRLNITLPVLDVEIIGGDGPVAEGSMVRLVCRTRGSNPPAQILWHNEGQHLTKAQTSFDDIDDLTTSIISLSVSRDADGAIVTCNAVNPVLMKGYMNASISLNVYYKPVVSLELGTPLQGQELKEGDNVFFECNVRANPVYQRITWSHNGVRIYHNTSLGIVISGLSLAVRSLKRENSGAYSCHASNSAGTTGSEPQYISVRHTPVCAGGSRHRTQGAARGEPSKVTCRVEAVPDAILSWRWSVLQDDGTELDFPELQVYTVEDSQMSSIMVTPSRPEDYGRLACRARNIIGWQHKPCVVALVAAGPPDTPANCTAAVEEEEHGDELGKKVDNQGVMLSIVCTEGYNGGLPQRFILEALLNNHSFTNLTSDFPEWSLNGIASGTGVTLKISAFNVRGMSDVIKMEVHTPQAEPRTISGAASNQVSPLVGALAGVFGVLLLVIIMGVLLRKYSRKRLRKSHSHKLVSMSALGQEDLDDPDVVSSIQRRPPSLDVLAHDLPHSISRTFNGHSLDNGQGMTTQGPPDSEISNTSDSESECNTVVNMGAATSQISISGKDLHKHSQNLYT